MKLFSFVLVLLAVGAAGQESVPTFGTTVVRAAGLRGLVYAIREGSWKLPDFSALKPFGAIYTNQLNIPPRDFEAGFPGLTKRFEWFAIDYRGRFWVEKPGKYKWTLLCDDGAKLWIDDKVVIDADGTHAPELGSGSITLEQGVHSLRVGYFQGPRLQVALVLEVAPPGEKYRVFNTDHFAPPPDVELARLGAAPQSSVPALALNELEPDLRRALAANPRPGAFAVRAGLGRFRWDGRYWQTMLALEVPVAELQATALADRKTSRLRLAVLGSVLDETGREAGQYRTEEPFLVPNDKLAAARQSAAVFTQPFFLPPGHYRVQFAAIDIEGGTASAGEIEVILPEAPPGPGLSSVTLVERVESAAKGDAANAYLFEGRRVVPTLIPALRQDAKPLAYFVAYPRKEAPAQLEVLFLVNGTPLARQEMALPAADATGAVPLLIALAMRPGANELRVTLRQDGAHTVSTLRYAVLSQ